MKSVALLILLALAPACGGAAGFASLKAGAKSGKALVAEFETIDHAAKRTMIDEHPECALKPEAKAVRACYVDALAPYTAVRSEVLKVVDDAVPVFAKAEKVLEAGDVEAPEIGPLGLAVVDLVNELTVAVAHLKEQFSKPAAPAGGVK